MNQQTLEARENAMKIVLSFPAGKWIQCQRHWVLATVQAQNGIVLTLVDATYELHEIQARAELCVQRQHHLLMLILTCRILDIIVQTWHTACTFGFVVKLILIRLIVDIIQRQIMNHSDALCLQTKLKVPYNLVFV